MTERFPQRRFIPRTSYHFQQVLFFHLLVSSMKHGFMVFQKDLFIIDNLANAKVIIKVPFCLLNKFSTKIALPFIR